MDSQILYKLDGYIPKVLERDDVDYTCLLIKEGKTQRDIIRELHADGNFSCEYAVALYFCALSKLAIQQ